MVKFKKKAIVTVLIGIIIIGGISYKLINKSKDLEKPKEEKKDILAMYVEDETGTFQISNGKTFPKEGYVLDHYECKNNGATITQDPETKKISASFSKGDSCNLYFAKEKLTTLKDYYDNVTKKTVNPTFSNIATTDETSDGLFAMADDYGLSYYFRGTAPNNYVKFGQDSSGQDMWWRIIRFNGDASIRIQYDGAGTAGTNTYTRGFALTSKMWSSGNDAKHVGWMYGGTWSTASTSKGQVQTNETNSSIKTAVDNWYKTNIVDTGYGNYVADSIFCNDRSTPGSNATGWTDDTGLGYGNNSTGYGFKGRYIKPQFTCPQKNDKFTVEESSGGNGALTYPVGLITGDEIVAAGGKTERLIIVITYIKKVSTGHSLLVITPVTCLLLYSPSNQMAPLVGNMSVTTTKLLPS